MQDPFYAFTVESNSETVLAALSVFTGRMPSTVVCLYDSGANCHVFNDSADFKLYQTMLLITVQGFGTDFSITAIGHGNIQLCTKHGAQSSTLLLTNVLHIPHARSNLISGTQLAKHNVFATLRDDGLMLSLHGIPFLDSSVQRGMYQLNVKAIRPSLTPPTLFLLCVDLNSIAVPDHTVKPDFCIT